MGQNKVEIDKINKNLHILFFSVNITSIKMAYPPYEGEGLI